MERPVTSGIAGLKLYVTDALEDHIENVQNAINCVQHDAAERRIPGGLFNNELRNLINQYEQDLADDAEDDE